MHDNVLVCWGFLYYYKFSMRLITNVLAEKQSKPGFGYFLSLKDQMPSLQTRQLDGPFPTKTQTAKATSADGCTLHWQQRIFRLYVGHLTTYCNHSLSSRFNMPGHGCLGRALLVLLVLLLLLFRGKREEGHGWSPWKHAFAWCRESIYSAYIRIWIL